MPKVLVIPKPFSKLALSDIACRFLYLSILLLCSSAMAQENCANGIDDDGDGLIDLLDPDCHCAGNTVSSIIPNPSFEEYAACPSSYSELHLATPWEQATNATTDYINHCNYISPELVGHPLLNFPDGNGIAGAYFLRNWNEYLGAPLNAPMMAGTDYQLTFHIACFRAGAYGLPDTTDPSMYETVNVTLYGNAGEINFPVDTYLSPDQYDASWQILGQVSYTPAENWADVTITFSPLTDIKNIMLGAPPVLPSTYPNNNDDGVTNFPYFIFDNLLLNEAAEFGVNIIQQGFFCDGNLILHANVTTNVSDAASFQWYKDGIAIVGATGTSLDVSALGENNSQYSVRVTDGEMCFTSNTRVNSMLPSPVLTVIQPTCIIPTALVTVTTAAQEYSFDNGVSWQSNNVMTLPLGTHYIKIKSASGCISASTGILVSPPALIPASGITVTQPEACGESGVVTISAPDIQEYSYDNGLTWTNESSATLLPGMYYIRIKDTNGCMSAPFTAMINEIMLPGAEVESVDPTCQANGSIRITTPADFYSFDNGQTWTPDPLAQNLAAGVYYIKIKNGTNCQSQTRYVYLNAFYLPLPEVESTAATCNISGSITVTTQAHEYSFDGGLSWSNQNTAYNLESGVYVIMIRDAQGCTSDPAYSFYLPETFSDTPSFVITHPYCTETTGSIVFTAEPGYQYSFDAGITYQSSPESGPLLPGYYNLKTIDAEGCESQVTSAYISSPTDIPPNPTGPGFQLFCEMNTPTVAFLQASGQNLLWYQIGNPNPLSSTDPLQSGIYFATQTVNGCQSVRRLEVEVAIISYDIPAANHQTWVCDYGNDGIENVNLNNYKPSLIAASENYTFSFFTTFEGAESNATSARINNIATYPLNDTNREIFVRITATNGCWKTVVLNLIKVLAPIIFMDDEFILCENSSVILTAPPGFDSYLWSTGQTTRSITVFQSGNYSITVSENHGTTICTDTKNVRVALSNPALISTIETYDWTVDDNRIIVHLDQSSIGDYEYSLDGQYYQDSNIFTALRNGEYRVYVRDKNRCGEVSQLVYLLMHPRYFTPNEDGYQDSWQIKFSHSEPQMKINIFDRYGKFLAEISPNGPGWDGTYNGKTMPATDYWFTVTRQNGQQHKGHFSLKR